MENAKYRKSMFEATIILFFSLLFLKTYAPWKSSSFSDGGLRGKTDMERMGKTEVFAFTSEGFVGLTVVQ